MDDAVPHPCAASSQVPARIRAEGRLAQGKVRQKTLERVETSLDAAGAVSRVR
jgi:hypothetical protein